MMFDRKPRAIARRTIAAVSLGLGAFVAPPAHAVMPPLNGTLPEPVSQAVAEGLFTRPETIGLRLDASHGDGWHVPVILVSFADEPFTIPAATFERQLFDTTGAMATGSVFDYYRWVSGGRLTVTGQVVASVRLPETQAFYAGGSAGLRGGTPNNAFGAVREVMRACADSIDWRPFDVDRDGFVDVVWIVHAGVGAEATGRMEDLWSVTAQMSRGWRESSAWFTKTPYPGGYAGQTLRVDLFCMLPELSAFVAGAPSEIGVFCHEFGHVLGLPDLYSTSPLSRGNTGTGHWSLMGSGGYGGDGQSPEYPTHLSAWPLRQLGWGRTIRPSRDTTISLAALAASGTIVDWSFQGESNNDHFLIEYRRREGFDRNLPNDGLVVYHLDEQVIENGLPYNEVNAGETPGLQVLEADGDLDIALGRNRGDANDPFPGALHKTALDDDTVPSTRTFLDAVSSLAIRDIHEDGGDMRFSLQVRAPGWLPSVDVSGGEYAPVEARSVARQSVVDSRGIAHTVGIEMRGGRPQVVLRSGAGMPTEAFQVSASPTGASDPTIALLPGDHIAIVWSDGRHGRSMLFYRSRVRGVWSDERLLAQGPGGCTHPSIVSSPRGTITLVFRYLESNKSQIRLMRFTYFSPFGTPIAATPMASVPIQPAIVNGFGGSTIILWNDRSLAIPRLMFMRHHPDSGFSPPMPLTPPPFYEQSWFTAATDSAGTLHVAWQVSGPGRNQIRYQRRPPTTPPWPIDLVLESRLESLGRPAIEAGSNGTVHLAFEATTNGLPLVRYKRMTDENGWDANSSEVTAPAEGAGEGPRVFPGPGDDVAIAYTAFPSAVPRFVVRRRSTSVPTTLEVPVAAAPGGGRLELGPNPLRPGQPLALRWSGAAAGPRAFEVFDIAGRRVAVLPNERGEGGLVVAPETTRRWASGVYFVRPRAIAGPAARLVVIP